MVQKKTSESLGSVQKKASALQFVNNILIQLVCSTLFEYFSLRSSYNLATLGFKSFYFKNYILSSSRRFSLLNLGLRVV